MRLIVLLAALAGCSSSKQAPDAATPAPVVVVTRLEVGDATPAEQRPVPLAAEALGRAWDAALEGVATRAKAPPAGAARVAIQARVVYGLSTGEGILSRVEPLPAGAEARATWAVEVRIRPPGASTGQYVFLEGSASVPVAPGADLPVVLAAQMRAALAPVIVGLRARTEVLALTPAALIARIDHADPAVRLAAVDRLGFLRDATAVEALAARTRKEKEREILLRLVGALAEIGDDRAAQALIGLANPRDRELLRAVVDALSVVGGRRVSDFLDILSTHDAADVREIVEQARARLARRPER